MTTFLLPGDMISFYVTSSIVIGRIAIDPSRRAPSSGDWTLRLFINHDRSATIGEASSATNNPVTRP